MDQGFQKTQFGVAMADHRRRFDRNRASRLSAHRRNINKRTKQTAATIAIPNWFQRLISPQESRNLSKNVLMEVLASNSGSTQVSIPILPKRRLADNNRYFPDIRRGGEGEACD